MSKSNFQKIVDFHKQFGLDYTQEPQLNVFDEKPKLVNFRVDLIEEEFNELKQAIKDKDFVEVMDALGDILYVTYGFGASIGVDMDVVYDLIHKSNMSKLCKTEDEAIETVKWYIEQYNEGKQPYDTPTYRISENGEYYVVYNKSSGKILKSIKYNMVDLKPLIQ